MNLRKISVVSALILALSVLATNSASAETFAFSSSPLTNLDPAGSTINGGFTKFPTTAGMYIQQCNEPAAGARPTVCSDTLQLWITTSGDPGSVKSTGPIAFKVAGQISGRGTIVDCTTTTCGLFFRLDHTASKDTSEDIFRPITFRAGSIAPVLPADEISVTLNGSLLTKNVPVNLGYQQSAKIEARTTSGLPVSFTSLTPECSFIDGKLIALKGLGQCALGYKTAGNDKFAAASGNFPFILIPGNQTIKGVTKSLKSGKPKALPTETSFGSPITYKSLSKNCRVEVNLVESKKSGICTIRATAPAKEGMWNSLRIDINLPVN